MQRRSRTLQSWGLYECLRRPALQGPLEWWAVPCVYRRKARTPLVLRPLAEGRGANTVTVGVARGVGVAKAGAEIGAPAKRKNIAPKVAQLRARRPPAWLTLRGWLQGPEDLLDRP